MVGHMPRHYSFAFSLFSPQFSLIKFHKFKTICEIHKYLVVCKNPIYSIYTYQQIYLPYHEEKYLQLMSCRQLFSSMATMNLHAYLQSPMCTLVSYAFCTYTDIATQPVQLPVPTQSPVPMQYSWLVHIPTCLCLPIFIATVKCKKS